MISIFDAHFHIINPKYPLVKNNGFLPKPFLFEDYINHAKYLNIKGGAIVSASYQGYDQSYLVEALRRLGPHFVGVTQLPYDTSDDKIEKLSKHGVKAIRYNIYNGQSFHKLEMERLANRVHEFGWHVEFHIASSSLKDIFSWITRLPAVTIDHLGLEEEGFSDLLRLIARGVKVKASGFGRVDFDVKKALKRMYSENPQALMFGTDLPSTRAKRPFSKGDIDLIYETFGREEAAMILYQNGQKWYLSGGRDGASRKSK